MNVTVVTPSFNQGRYIERTLRSVAEQGVGNIEHLVIDGGSTDETVAILQAFEPRVDWDAGFRAALDRCSESILAPGLADDVGYLEQHIRPLLPTSALGELREIWRRVAQPCWSGERAAITRADLLAAVRAANLSADARARIEEVLAR